MGEMEVVRSMVDYLDDLGVDQDRRGKSWLRSDFSSGSALLNDYQRIAYEQDRGMDFFRSSEAINHDDEEYGLENEACQTRRTDFFANRSGRRKLDFERQKIEFDVKFQCQEAMRRSRTRACLLDLESLVSSCESPIEKAIAPWFITCEFRHFPLGPVLCASDELSRLERGQVGVVSQHRIYSFRVDFALVGRRGDFTKLLVVECDGSEFHDGFENVKRDVDRDSKLLAHSQVLDVFRLSGSEIFRSPMLAARRAIDVFCRCWEHPFQPSRPWLNDKFKTAT